MIASFIVFAVIHWSVTCRSIVEPIRNSKFRMESHYHLAQAVGLDTERQTVRCVNVLDDSATEYDLPYNKLVIGVGARPNTFNIPGVTEHALFLKVTIDLSLVAAFIVSIIAG